MPAKLSQELIAIGPHNFTVHEIPPQLIEPEYGHINYGALVIHLNASCSPSVKCETLYHEVLHGLLEGGGFGHLLKEAGVNEEALVQSLSMGLVDTLRRSPSLIQRLKYEQ